MRPKVEELLEKLDKKIQEMKTNSHPVSPVQKPNTTHTVDKTAWTA